MPISPLNENRIALNHTRRFKITQRRQQFLLSIFDTAKVEIKNLNEYIILFKDVIEKIDFIKLFNK